MCVSVSHASGFVLCISVLSVFKHIFWILPTNSSHLPVQKTSWTSWNKGSLRRRRCSIPFSRNWTRSLTGEWPVCTWSGFQLCEHHSLFKQWCLLYVYNEDLNTSVNIIITTNNPFLFLDNIWVDAKIFRGTYCRYEVIDCGTLPINSCGFLVFSVKSVAREQKDEIVSQLQTIRYLMKKRGMKSSHLTITGELYSLSGTWKFTHFQCCKVCNTMNQIQFDLYTH